MPGVGWCIRRRICWLAVIASCEKKEAPPPTPARAPVVVADAAPVDAPDLVELTGNVPMTITVSSTVANPRILPGGLADHDLATAWNSQTGRLVGEWIEIAVPDAQIYEVRMTVGFTGRGPKGEDYFAMNHRISKISVMSNDKAISTVALDPNNRGLQTIRLTGTTETRLRIDAVVPGTRKDWREAAISELEVWGTTKLSPTLDKPTVEVVAPDKPEPGAEAFQSLCADAREKAKHYAANHASDLASCEGSPTEEAKGACRAELESMPQCDLLPETGLPAPWALAAYKCDHVDMYGDPWLCDLHIRVDDRFVTGPVFPAEHDDEHSGYTAPTLDKAIVADLLPNPGNELFVRVKGKQPFAFVCVVQPTMRCSDLIADDVLAKLPDEPTKLPPDAVKFSK